MNVGLVFNLKKERQDDSGSDDSFSSVKFLNKSNAEHKLQTVDDTYAEWDTWETINAVKNALEENHNVILIEANEDAFEKLRKIDLISFSTSQRVSTGQVEKRKFPQSLKC